jgi:hypothetical protein
MARRSSGVARWTRRIPLGLFTWSLGTRPRPVAISSVSPSDKYVYVVSRERFLKSRTARLIEGAGASSVARSLTRDTNSPPAMTTTVPSASRAWRDVHRARDQGTRGARSASANSETVENRSAGCFASALTIASSTPRGTVGRTV